MVDLSIRNIYEALPLPFAWATLMYIGYKFLSSNTRKKSDIINYSFGAVICVLFILAQAGWLMAVLSNKLEDQYFSDLIWTLFNSIVVAHVFYNAKMGSKSKNETTE